ncbi:hypothetical protein CDAR_229081 [Caerostris darwini]|uniref:Uncharacterized protein n=1 Tax=Caerostris darwini TaxID=1538125 RepID=A0AAV4RH19_9ARAC|nr:hypothetical protein CDAR_229021 [Caerostris darwini]GIY20794.1 hypothetical protein CDAR_229081 [Caerostris darwini]
MSRFWRGPEEITQFFSRSAFQLCNSTPTEKSATQTSDFQKGISLTQANCCTSRIESKRGGASITIPLLPQNTYHPLGMSAICGRKTLVFTYLHFVTFLLMLMEPECKFRTCMLSRAE